MGRGHFFGKDEKKYKELSCCSNSVWARFRRKMWDPSLKKMVGVHSDRMKLWVSEIGRASGILESQEWEHKYDQIRV